MSSDRPGKKRLLILAGAAVHIKLVDAARAMGLYTIVADYLPPEDSPAKLIADEHWSINIIDTDALFEKVRESGGVDGVLAYCIDPAQIPYVELCQRLRLPCYGTREQFEIMTDKAKFKKFCLSCEGIDVIPEYTLEDCLEGRADFPVLVKPNKSRGSRGQTVCLTAGDVREAVSTASDSSLDGKYLIEKFIRDARDISLCYFVVDGEPHIAKLADRYPGKAEDKLDRQQMAACMPSVYTREILSECDLNVRNLIRRLGIKFGPVFFQAFYKDGHIYMYDPGLRFPGSDFDLAVKAATGIDFASAAIRYALNGNPAESAGDDLDRSIFMNGGHCLLLSFSVHAGTISEIGGVEEMRRDPYVVSINVLRKPGDTVSGYGDVTQRVIEICAYVPENASLEDFIIKAYDTVTILDDSGSDMIVSRAKNDLLCLNGISKFVR